MRKEREWTMTIALLPIAVFYLVPMVLSRSLWHKARGFDLHWLQTFEQPTHSTLPAAAGASSCSLYILLFPILLFPRESLLRKSPFYQPRTAAARCRLELAGRDRQPEDAPSSTQ